MQGKADQVSAEDAKGETGNKHAAVLPKEPNDLAQDSKADSVAKAEAARGQAGSPTTSRRSRRSGGGKTDDSEDAAHAPLDQPSPSGGKEETKQDKDEDPEDAAAQDAAALTRRPGE